MQMNMQAAEQAPAPGLPGFLEKWQWYRALPAELRSLTLKTATERTAAAGEYIARTGEPSTHWYGVMRGYLQMYVVGPGGSGTSRTALPGLPGPHPRVLSWHES